MNKVFHKRKDHILSSIHYEKDAQTGNYKRDKSLKKCIDVPILEVVEAINNSESFVTTSSCSGRVTVFSSLEDWDGSQTDSGEDDASVVLGGMSKEATSGTAAALEGSVRASDGPVVKIKSITPKLLTETVPGGGAAIDAGQSVGRVSKGGKGTGRLIYVDHGPSTDPRAAAKAVCEALRDHKPFYATVGGTLPDTSTGLTATAASKTAAAGPTSSTDARMSEVSPARRNNVVEEGGNDNASKIDATAAAGGALASTVDVAIVENGTRGAVVATSTAPLSADGPAGSPVAAIPPSRCAAGLTVVLKFEPFVLHVEGESSDDVLDMLEAARRCGLQQSGVCGLRRRHILAVRGSQILEVPLYFRGIPAFGSAQVWGGGAAGMPSDDCSSGLAFQQGQLEVLTRLFKFVREKFIRNQEQIRLFRIQLEGMLSRRARVVPAHPPRSPPPYPAASHAPVLIPFKEEAADIEQPK
eukprot:GHVU01158351.1.p1 GENE.GHVU01158351.1~~GHVU01158351.1.p1  ORF type:complete len:470 (+),score=57.52 GHVU01158351.1:1300-2709(+)